MLLKSWYLVGVFLNPSRNISPWISFPQHSFWSGMLSVAMGFFLTFSATALLKHPVFRKWIAYYAFLAHWLISYMGCQKLPGKSFLL